MKLDLNGWVGTIGQGMLLTVGYMLMSWLVGFAPHLLAAIPRG